MAKSIDTVSKADIAHHSRFNHMKSLVDQWKKPNDAVQNQANDSSRLSPNICLSIYLLVLLCIVSVIPTLQVAIGTTYRTECTINPNIPVYLIVAGTCGWAHFLLGAILVRYHFSSCFSN